MIKTLYEMSPEEEKAYIDKINDCFKQYIVVAPNIILSDFVDGEFVKIKTCVDDGMFSIGEIIFQLQLRLYQHKKMHPEKENLSMIVSKISLTNQIPNTAFRRGVMIKIKYE